MLVALELVEFITKTLVVMETTLVDMEWLYLYTKQNKQ